MWGRLYADVWANFWTPSVWTLLAIVISHMLHRKSMATKVDRIRAEADAAEERLHERITALLARKPAGGAR